MTVALRNCLLQHSNFKVIKVQIVVCCCCLFFFCKIFLGFLKCFKNNSKNSLLKI